MLRHAPRAGWSRRAMQWAREMVESGIVNGCVVGAPGVAPGLVRPLCVASVALFAIPPAIRLP